MPTEDDEILSEPEIPPSPRGVSPPSPVRSRPGHSSPGPRAHRFNRQGGRLPSSVEHRHLPFHGQYRFPRMRDRKFNLVGHVIGPGGETLKRIESEMDVRITVMGPDGRKLQRNYVGDGEGVYCYVSGRSEDSVARSVDRIGDIVDVAMRDPEEHSRRRRDQLLAYARMKGGDSPRPPLPRRMRDSPTRDRSPSRRSPREEDGAGEGRSLNEHERRDYERLKALLERRIRTYSFSPWATVYPVVVDPNNDTLRREG